jgi:hypothetical protein
MKLSTEILAFIDELRACAVESEINIPSKDTGYYNGSKHAFLHAADMAEHFANRLGQMMINQDLEMK